MSEERVRCDHCEKWMLHGDCLMAHTSAKYEDGTLGICEKCTKTHVGDTAYWDKWYLKKHGKYKMPKVDVSDAILDFMDEMDLPHGEEVAVTIGSKKKEIAIVEVVRTELTLNYKVSRKKAGKD